MGCFSEIVASSFGLLGFPARPRRALYRPLMGCCRRVLRSASPDWLGGAGECIERLIDVDVDIGRDRKIWVLGIQVEV